MDQKRFDELTRGLAEGSTRRGVVRGILGGAAAGVAGLLGLGQAADAKKKCKNGKTLCGNKCINLDNNGKHCGKCNRKCRGDEVCRRGKCRGTSS